MSSMDEKQLVAQVLSGNDGALRILIGKYERLVAHMVARVVPNNMDREELCQDVFVKVYEKLNSFHFESKLSTWIATISYRMAINFAKKKSLDQVDIDDVTLDVMENDSSYETEDYRRFVVDLVDKLPVSYKMVITLFYLDGFSYPEIVEVTGMPEGTVKNYLHRAKKKLKEIVERHAEKEVELI